MHFTTKQINELITGVILTAETKSSSRNYRHFISIGAYTHKGRMNKIINDAKKNELYFWIKSYEYPKEYIENDWDDCEEAYVNMLYINDIKGIKSAELELEKVITNMSLFVPIWETDAPA